MDTESKVTSLLISKELKEKMKRRIIDMRRKMSYPELIEYLLQMTIDSTKETILVARIGNRVISLKTNTTYLFMNEDVEFHLQNDVICASNGIQLTTDDFIKVCEMNGVPLEKN